MKTSGRAHFLTGFSGRDSFEFVKVAEFVAVDAVTLKMFFRFQTEAQKCADNRHRRVRIH